MHVEVRHFLIFENILISAKNFWNCRNFFSSSAVYYFLQKFRYIKKNSWFLFLDKSQVQKSVDAIICFSCTVKKLNFKSIQAHSGPLPPFPILSFSKSLVCIFCLFTQFLSVLFVFHRKNVVLLHRMNRYTTSTSE